MMNTPFKLVSCRLFVFASCILSSLVGCSQWPWFNKPSDNITLATPLSKERVDHADTLVDKPSSTAEVAIVDKAASGPLRLPSVVAQTATVQNYPYRVVTSSATAPTCKVNNCPTVTVKLVVFDRNAKINAFLDQSLAALGEIDSSSKPPHRSIAAFKAYFFSMAKPGQSVVIESSVLHNTKALVAIQLNSAIFTDTKHVVSTTQYLNWLPLADQLVTLDGMLLPNKSKDFEQLVRREHEQWLQDHADVIGDLDEFKKIWPFVATDNVALLSNGLQISYDPVVLAPDKFGSLSWVIPYDQLTNMLRPELLPSTVIKK